MNDITNPFIIGALILVLFVAAIVCYIGFLYDLSKLAHRCKDTKPIISRYISFNERDIIYQCYCGKRHVTRVYMPFGKPFPIPTTPHITHAEFLKYLNN